MLPSEIKATTKLPFKEAFAIFKNAIDAGDFELAEDPMFHEWGLIHQEELANVQAP